MNVAVFKTV